MAVKLELITLAATHVDEIVAFYNAVLDTQLAGEDTPMGVTIYTGKLAEITFQVCPNDLAGVEANQNRQQFQLIVDDAEAAFNAALAHGGQKLQPVQAVNGMKIASVYDPDGNSIVFRSEG